MTRTVAALDDAGIDEIVAAVRFDAAGLVPAIAQQHDTGEVLMIAWMNAESLRLTLQQQRVVYWSRSRGELWRKGDTSGHSQRLVELAVDCDADALRLKVDQVGAACHLGTRTCWDADPLAVRFAPSESAPDSADEQARPGNGGA